MKATMRAGASAGTESTARALEREVETDHGTRLLRHVRGNPDMELSRSLPHRATSRLYP